MPGFSSSPIKPPGEDVVFLAGNASGRVTKKFVRESLDKTISAKQANKETARTRIEANNLSLSTSTAKDVATRLSRAEIGKGFSLKVFG